MNKLTVINFSYTFREYFTTYIYYTIKSRSFKIWILWNKTFIFTLGGDDNLPTQLQRYKFAQGNTAKSVQRETWTENWRRQGVAKRRTRQNLGSTGAPKCILYEDLINEYNPSVHDSIVAIVECSYMFRLLQIDHHQSAYQVYKKILSSNYM